MELNSVLEAMELHKQVLTPTNLTREEIKNIRAEGDRTKTFGTIL